MVVTACADGTLNIFDIESGDIIRSMEGHNQGVTSVAFHPTGQYIISGSRRGIKFWDSSTGTETRDFRISTQMVRAMDISPDGEHVITANSNGFLCLWRTFDNYLVHEFKEQPYMTDVEISPDCKWIIASSGQGSVMLWDIEEQSLGKNLTGHGDYVSAVAFSPDGTYAMSGGYDARINIYDLETREVVQVFENPKGGMFSSASVNYVDWSPDGVHILAAGRNKVINVWNIETELIVKKLEGHTADITVARWTSNGKYIISGDARGAVRVWDVWADPLEGEEESE